MYTIDKLVQHIEHLGFHVLMKIDKEDESILMVEESIAFVSKISKIRKFLNSNFKYDLSWKTSCIHYHNKFCNMIVLNVSKKEKKNKAA